MNFFEFYKDFYFIYFKFKFKYFTIRKWSEEVFNQDYTILRLSLLVIFIIFKTFNILSSNH